MFRNLLIDRKLCMNLFAGYCDFTWEDGGELESMELVSLNKC